MPAPWVIPAVMGATGVGQSVFGNKAAKNRQKDALDAQRKAQRAAQYDTETPWGSTKWHTTGADDQRTKVTTLQEDDQGRLDAYRRLSAAFAKLLMGDGGVGGGGTGGPGGPGGGPGMAQPKGMLGAYSKLPGMLPGRLGR